MFLVLKCALRKNLFSRFFTEGLKVIEQYRAYSEDLTANLHSVGAMMVAHYLPTCFQLKTKRNK